MAIDYGYITVTFWWAHLPVARQAAQPTRRAAKILFHAALNCPPRFVGVFRPIVSTKLR